jgi:hypothetical protein
MATRERLIDAWAEAGLPRERAAGAVVALEDYLEATVADRQTLEAHMAELDANLGARLAELERSLGARTDALERRLGRLTALLTLGVVGLIALQLALLWAILRLPLAAP